MDYTQYALLLKAFADEKRMRILHLLYYRQEMAEKDINRITAYKTKRHLDYLNRDGLIDWREEGQITFYKIREEHKPFAEAILSRLTDDKTLQDDLKKYDELLYKGELASLPQKTISHQ